MHKQMSIEICGHKVFAQNNERRDLLHCETCKWFGVENTCHHPNAKTPYTLDERLGDCRVSGERYERPHKSADWLPWEVDIILEGETPRFSDARRLPWQGTERIYSVRPERLFAPPPWEMNRPMPSREEWLRRFPADGAYRTPASHRPSDDPNDPTGTTEPRPSRHPTSITHDFTPPLACSDCRHAGPLKSCHHPAAEHLFQGHERREGGGCGPTAARHDALAPGEALPDRAIEVEGAGESIVARRLEALPRYVVQSDLMRRAGFFEPPGHARLTRIEDDIRRLRWMAILCFAIGLFLAAVALSGRATPAAARPHPVDIAAAMAGLPAGTAALPPIKRDRPAPPLR